MNVNLPSKLEQSGANQYCAYIDVLGYGSIVKDETISKLKKERIFYDIYENLAVNFVDIINSINSIADQKDKVLIKSFSDCFYLSSFNLINLLETIQNIYSNVFTFFGTFSPDKAYTPFLRGGIVKDWVLNAIDISSYFSNKTETFIDKILYNNPVGPGVAKSYWIAEKSFISGMRIILSKDVFDDIISKELNIESAGKFYYYFSKNNNVTFKRYVFPIIKNEKGETVQLYELCWVSSSNNIFSQINQLIKSRSTFSEKVIRHWNETAKLFVKALVTIDDNEKYIELINIYEDKLNKLL